MADTIPNLRSYLPEPGAKLRAWRRVVWQYCISILAVAVALAIKLSLASELRGEASYLFFLPPVLIASALAGWGPGLLGTVLGLALGLVFVLHVRALETPDVIDAVTFALVGIGVSWRGELLDRFRRAATASAEAAFAREAH